MTLDISEFTPMLKIYYSPRNVELMAYKRHPTLRLLSKRTDWTGDTYDMPIWHEGSQAISRTFGTALAEKGEGSYTKFVLSRSKIYGFASIDRLALKASMGDKRAFMRAYTAEVDGVMKGLGREIAMNVFRTRAVVRGRIGSVAGAASGVLTLANRSDHIHFHLNMSCVFSDAGGAAGATLNLGGVNYYVIAIDRSAGSLTFSATRGGSAVDFTGEAGDALVATDFIHREGDVTASSNTLGLAGFEEWVPESAPGATTFYGVNRSVDTDKLGGLRVDASGYTVEDALVLLGERCFEQEADVSHVVMHTSRIAELTRERQSKLILDEETSKKIGCSAFKLATPAGEISVFGDALCQPNTMWGLDVKSWELVSTGVLPEIFDEDVTMLRESTTDSYEVRMGGYGNLGCHSPGSNINVKLA